MDSKKISSWIDGIIQDLTDQTKTLQECLRKTLVLAYTLKNDKLKVWVESELNGYEDNAHVPEYRRVGLEVWGNLVQPTFGGLITRSESLHYAGADHPFFAELRSGYVLTLNVAGLEMVVRPRDSESGAYLTYSVNPFATQALNKLYPNWKIEKSWIQISELDITATLSQIKNNLLQFLLALNEETGEEVNYSIMGNSEKVDRILEHTIGYIHAENVTFGNNYQTKGNQNTVTQGNNNTHQVSSPETLMSEVKALSAQITNLLGEVADIRVDIKEDIFYQLQAVNSQIGRTEPNLGLVGKSLQIIEGLLLNVAATAYTPTVLGVLADLIPRLN